MIDMIYKIDIKKPPTWKSVWQIKMEDKEKVTVLHICFLTCITIST